MNHALPLDSDDRQACRDLFGCGHAYGDAEQMVLRFKLQRGWLPARRTVSDSVAPWEWTLS